MKNNKFWKQFDEKYAYTGSLGAIHTDQESIFKVWAPTLSKLELCIYESEATDAKITEKLEMKRGTISNPEQQDKNTIGLWEYHYSGDCAGLVYTLLATYQDGSQKETMDPYAKAAIANGYRSVVLGQNESTSARQKEAATWRLEKFTDAIIEEIHTRDFSQHPSSEISEQHRGKFLGLVETGSKNKFGNATGIDYLKEYGVNTVQLLPVYDFATVDELGGEPHYNWGYDPLNYNVPEGSYATDAKNPLTRIHELKQTIEQFHEEGFNVVMDVVYNHMYDSSSSPFEVLVPGYYFRKTQAGVDGTNDVASERQMVSQFIFDSIEYWTLEYGFDGYRFDLMGMLDIATMNKIRARLDEIDPRIMLYGEGWNMPTALAENERSIQKNLGKMPRIGMFNDDFRDSFKGSKFGGKTYGFIDGLKKRAKNTDHYNIERVLINGLKGSRGQYPTQLAPEQAINYVEAHDNYNLNDHFWVSHPDDDKQTHQKRVELATSLNLLAAGVPFMEIGQAFMRSKFYPTGENGQMLEIDYENAENSYRAGDQVNLIDWDLLYQHQETFKFIKKIIKLRKENPVFRLNNFDQINQNFQLEVVKAGLIIYRMGKYRIVANASGRPVKNKNCGKMVVTNSESENYFTDLSISILEA